MEVGEVNVKVKAGSRWKGDEFGIANYITCSSAASSWIFVCVCRFVISHANRFDIRLRLQQEDTTY